MRHIWIALAALATTPAIAAPHLDTTRPADVVYPLRSQSSGEQGAVQLDVYIRPDGTPTRISIAGSSGHERLDTAAAQSAMNWRYIPDAAGESGWTKVQVIYRLPD